MFLSLLENETNNNSMQWVTYVMLGVIVVALIAMMIFSSRSNKKRQKEAEDLMKAVKPGNKVKTIGGVCGIVVEVDDEENTFVLETGSEATGKCYMKFDKQAIYQTDAVVPKDDKKAHNEKEEEIKEEEKISETPSEVKTEEAQAPAENENKE